MICNKGCKYYKHCWSRGEDLIEDGEECELYEPDRPHGEWIINGVFDNGYQVNLECSHCKNMISGNVWNYKFCPNCGSDNRKEGEGHD